MSVLHRFTGLDELQGDFGLMATGEHRLGRELGAVVLDSSVGQTAHFGQMKTQWTDVEYALATRRIADLARFVTIAKSHRDRTLIGVAAYDGSARCPVILLSRVRRVHEILSGLLGLRNNLLRLFPLSFSRYRCFTNRIRYWCRCGFRRRDRGVSLDNAWVTYRARLIALLDKFRHRVTLRIGTILTVFFVIIAVLGVGERYRRGRFG